MRPKNGSRVFLRFDSPSRGRVLEPGTVDEMRENNWTLSFESRPHAVENGEKKLIYHGGARDFFEQQVIVKEQSSDGPRFVLTIEPIEEAISVATREEIRVSTVEAGLTATLEEEADCPVCDVSFSGLAVVSTWRYHVGQCLEIALRYGDDEYVGQVEVQGVHAIDAGKTRYGLLGVFDTPEGRNLQNGLTRMTLGIQQQNLKRTSDSS